MKKIISLIIAAALLLSTFLICPLTTSAKDGKDIISPESGQVFEISDDVEIKIVTTHFINDKDNFCEVLVYRGRDGLKVAERDLPYTGVGQTITTTYNAAESGSFVVYISYYYQTGTGGFIQYQDDRKMYLLNGSVVHAHDAASFTVEDSSATEPTATEPPATEPPATEPSAKTITTGIGEYRIKDDGTAELVSAKDATFIFDLKPSGYTLTSIGANAFKNNQVLGTVPIPDTVTSIGDNAFDGCKHITEMNIPKSVTHIGTSIFANCTGLNTITVDAENPVYSDLGGKNIITEIDTDTLLACGIGVNEIPDNIKHIGDYVFANRQNLEEIHIPDSVESIGGHAFSNCSLLKSINIPESVVSIGNGAFSDCNDLKTVTCTANITHMGANVFAGTQWYADQPEGLIYVGKAAYKYKGECPEEMELKDETLCIAVAAFSMQTGLKRITIPDSVLEIGENAFKLCSNLEEVDLGNSVQRILDHAIFWCDNLKSITVPASVTYIASRWEALGYTNTNTGFAPIEGFTIYGYSGTEAEKYANEKGFTFVSLGELSILGDADGSGEVDAADATVIQRVATMIAVPYDEEQLMCADIDDDGDLTIVDATFIQRYSTRIAVPYPIGEEIE